MKLVSVTFLDSVDRHIVCHVAVGSRQHLIETPAVAQVMHSEKNSVTFFAVTKKKILLCCFSL